MNRPSIILFSLIFLVTSWSCCGSDEIEPPSSLDLPLLVEEVVHQWLDVRVSDQEDLNLARLPEASWRVASTVEEFALSVELSSLGRVEAIFEDVKNSSIYKENPVEDEIILELVKGAIDSFTYVE